MAGATRGCGRGIAAALGEAGATVVCTGRSSRTRALRSDYDRAETIEETADLVTRLGGTGLARPVDHLDPGQVRDLAGWIRDRFGRIDVLVNDIWGAELRAVAALAADPGRARWNQQSVSSGWLAREYGFTDLDGTAPDIWRYIVQVREPGRDASLDDYR